ncbi:hypothetical protein P170DRAFT_433105 [Aspergillus steynii IBT 23096]|uniref:C6 finger domain protein n=1 Tax=Aspergillus steynii IBT 23096 TaxID=1392250 RepID=A0A2I2GRT6_9EURO|nr:uncharacterized protein P170DRAFT_433105 [Aspergillus steynii IBT 23096]PLB55586.1 hypothetical protein P170DRAFT_433105 [Aspergillus steynii IBT 23096]
MHRQQVQAHSQTQTRTQPQSQSQSQSQLNTFGTAPGHISGLQSEPHKVDNFIRTVFHTLYHHNLFRLSDEAENLPGYIARNAGRKPFQDAAVACLTCISRAHESGDQSMLKTGRHLYAQALREVVAGLYGEEALSADMLSAIMMLAVYEMYARTSPGAWAVHVDGVRRLMRSRGAEGHGEGLARSNFLVFRGFLVLAALGEGAPCFLEEEEWRVASWGTAREDAARGGAAARWVDVEERVFEEVVRLPRFVSEARQGGERVGREMGRTRQRLEQLGLELRAGMEAHAPRVRIAGATMPDGGPWLLLQGVESAMALLDGLLARQRSDGRFRPFRIVCGLDGGPSAMPRIEGVTWLDQVASSLGMIGTMVVDGH